MLCILKFRLGFYEYKHTLGEEEAQAPKHLTMFRRGFDSCLLWQYEVMNVVGLNLILLSAIGLLYLELPFSNRVPGVNDFQKTGNGSLALMKHPLVPAQ